MLVPVFSLMCNYLAIPLGAVCFLCAVNYVYSSLRFKYDLHRFQNATFGESLPTPHLPSVVPWLGNAPSFLTTKPLAFWRKLFEWYPRDAGVCTMTMGGETLHVVFNAPASQYIIKDRKLGRDKFTEMVVMNGMGLSAKDCELYNAFHTPPEPGQLSAHAQQEKVNLEYLLKTEHVNELTGEFLQTMRDKVAGDFEDGQGEIDLYPWLRTLMFNASTTAVWGGRILKQIPDLEDLFFTYDKNLLSMFYGLPKFMISKQLAHRDEVIEKLVDFYNVADAELDGKMIDPVTVAWEPIYGSRLSRARQVYSRNRGLSKKGIAGIELGFLFGLSSNAIPATGWMLFHILDSMKGPEKPSLYDYVMAEIDASKKDGKLDVSLLVAQPILHSTLHEVLRLYIDTLVTREINQDIRLPLTPEKSANPRSVLVKAGSLLMMPTYPAHTDPVAWQSPEYPHHPPADVFYPYRFLTSAPAGKDKPVFTTAHVQGKFFPFGGGRTMCPGRVFAKQEMIGGVATCLDIFDFKVINYLDEQKRPSDKFPVLRDSLPGSALMVPGGDMKVVMKRR